MIKDTITPRKTAAEADYPYTGRFKPNDKRRDTDSKGLVQGRLDRLYGYG